MLEEAPRDADRVAHGAVTGIDRGAAESGVGSRYAEVYGPALFLSRSCHLFGSFQFSPKALAFLADRFAGKPLPRASDC